MPKPMKRCATSFNNSNIISDTQVLYTCILHIPNQILACIQGVQIGNYYSIWQILYVYAELEPTEDDFEVTHFFTKTYVVGFH